MSANPPARPGAVNPAGMSVIMTGPSTPVHSTSAPSTIPAGLISSIINASGNTSIQTAQVIDVGNYPGGVLSFSGNLVNNSNLFLISTNPSISTATIKANNIFNSPGSLITTVLPTSGLAGYDLSSLVNHLNLSLLATNALANAGTISSAGNLSISGQAIYNAPVAGTTAAAPIISANQNVNIFSPNISNAGTISSALANVNIAGLSSATAQNILFNNGGGLVQALNGSIVFGDPLLTDKINTSLLGGDFIAKTLELNSGNGILNVDVHDISRPVLNANCGEIHIYSDSSINLGAMKVSGDPFIESSGDVYLIADTEGSADPTNAPFTVTAAGSIINISCDHINYASDITYIAGKSINLTGISQISSTGTIVLNALGGGLVVPANISSNGGVHLSAVGGDLIAGNISSLGKPGFYIKAGEYPSVVFPSVSLFAHGNVTAGSVDNHSGMVWVGAGGEIVSGLETPGIHPGNVSIGTVDISPTTVKDGSILIYGGSSGNISTQSLIGAGGRFVVLAPGGDVTISSSKAGSPVVSNNGATVREPGNAAFLADLTIMGNNVTISGSQFLADNSHSLISAGFGGVVDLKIDKIVSRDTLGTGSELVVVGESVNLSTFSSGKIEFDTTVRSSGKYFFHDAYTLTTVNALNSIAINAPLFVDASATTIANGGGIVFSAFQLSAVSSIQASANGFDSGSGGGVTLVGAGQLILDPNALNLHADGGTAGSGGSINITSGSGLIIDTKVFSASAGAAGNGNGGSVTLDASANDGQLFITGPINVDGSGTGNGGSVRLLNGAGSFQLGKSNLISAQSGLDGGDGGSVYLKSGGDLSVKSSLVKVDARGAEGNGGSLSFLSNGHLSVVGALKADGKGAGSGGSILLANGNSDFVVGGPDSDVSSISANSGLISGDGGSIEIHSGGNLLVDATKVHATTRGADGNGGIVSLSAGEVGGGALIVNGSINVSGKGTGNGGNILLTALSQIDSGGGGGVGALAAFAALAAPVVQSPGTIEVNGNLTANAGVDGNGGIISINSTSVASADQLPAGAVVQIGTAASGSQAATTYSVTANGGTNSGDGGQIAISSNGEILLSTSVISTNARGTGNGGQILITRFASPFIDDGSGTSGPTPISLNLTGRIQSNGGTDGTGGFIQIANQDGDLSVGATGTSSAITALGGTDSGSGGYVGLSSTNALTLASPINVSSRGVGDGGVASISSGEALEIGASLTANGGTEGKGGNISLSSNADLTLLDIQIMGRGGTKAGSGGEIALFASNGVSGDGTTLNASASSDGEGGVVSITNIHQGIGLSEITILARGSGSGKGGAVLVTSESDISAPSLSPLGLISVSGSSGGTVEFSSSAGLSLRTIIEARGLTEDGGSISVSSANNLEIKGNLLADGGVQSGSGGKITLTSISGELSVGDGTSSILCTARGKGEGGQVRIISAEQMHLALLQISVDSKSAGNAGSVFLSSKNSGINCVAKISSSQLGDSGDGGLISVLTPNGSSFFNGDFTSNSKSGNGGELFFDGPSTTVIGNQQAKGAVQGGEIIHYFDGVDSFTGNLDVSGKSVGGFILIAADDKLLVNGSILANGSYSAGSIILLSNQTITSSSPFVVGSGALATGNGVTGVIQSVGNIGTNETGGRGGLTIDSGLNKAGIEISKGESINIHFLDSRVFLNAPLGTVTIRGHLSQDFKQSSSGDTAGWIAINAKNVDVTDAQLTATNLNGKSGSIWIAASQIIGNSNSLISATGDFSIAPSGNKITGEIVLLPINGVQIVSNVVYNVLTGEQIGSHSSAKLTGGHGGSLELGTLRIVASGPSQAGNITIDADSLKFSGAFSSVANALTNGNGGNITIGNSNCAINLTSHVSLAANGHGDPAAGSIHISSNSDLTISSIGSSISISAIGGIFPTTQTSNLINVSVSTSKNLVVDGNAIKLSPLENNNGGTLSLSAGEKLTLAGNFVANSPAGNGGSITCSAQSMDLSNLKNISALGLLGGGQISINSTGNSDLTVHGKMVVDGASSAGQIQITSAGNILLDGANLIATGIDTNNVSLSGNSISMQGIGLIKADIINLQAVTEIGTVSAPILTQNNGTPNTVSIKYQGNTGDVYISQKGAIKIDECAIPGILSVTVTKNGFGSANIESTGTGLGGIAAGSIVFTTDAGNIGANKENPVIVGGSTIRLQAPHGSIWCKLALLNDRSGNLYQNPVILSSSAEGDFEVKADSVPLNVNGTLTSTAGSIRLNAPNQGIALWRSANVFAKKEISLVAANSIALGRSSIIAAPEKISILVSNADEKTPARLEVNLDAPGLQVTPNNSEFRINFQALRWDATEQQRNVITARVDRVSQIYINSNTAQSIDLGGEVLINGGDPIAFTLGEASSTIRSSKLEIGELLYWTDFDGVVSSDTIHVQRGSFLFRASRQARISLPDSTNLEMGKGSVVIVDAIGKEWSVKNLSSILAKLSLNKNTLDLGAGQEYRTKGKSDFYGITRRMSTSFYSGKMELSEFSLMSLLKNHPLMSSLRQSPVRGHRKLIREVLKIGAALNIVTASHGSFSR